MEKCRICLRNRKRMNSLYDGIEKSLTITYADVVVSFSNVKVSKNDGLPNEVCAACCKKLWDIYEFRCQVERSDSELQKTCQLKRILFTDIQDIKSKIEIKNSNDSKDAMVLHDIITEKLVKSSENALNYNNTIIKKLKNSVSTDKKKMSVKEFLESIKEDPDNEYDIIYDVAVDYDTDSDVEHDVDFDMKSDPGSDEKYNPIKQYNYCNKKLSKKDVLGNKNSIKPVYLSDIRVARTKLPVKKRNAKKSTKAYRDKTDMCPHCGKMVKSLKEHVLTHTGERNFSCEMCSKRFFTKYTLKSHLKVHANVDYKCDKCVATLKTASGFKMHQMIHTGDAVKIPCEICGKTFRSKGHLWRHCQGVHNMGEKKYSCDQCSRSFISKANLNHHMRVHTGERPYKCEICSQPYSYRRDFIRHCFKKHGVFLKGRQVYVLNKEVLVKERAFMSNLMLRVNENVKDDNPINPFKGSHAVKVFEQAVKALAAKQIEIDVPT